MSEPRDPSEPGTEPAEAPAEHHGLVEEIREEIAEVVEHVPKPVRWTVSRILKLAVLAFVAFLVVAIVSAILYVVNRTEWVAQELALLANQALARHSDLVLEMSDIRGNPFTGVTVVAPRLRERAREGAPLIEAERIVVHYSAWGLMFGGRGPIVVEVVRPVMTIEADPDGHWRLPRWVSGVPKPPSEKGYDLEFQVRDGSVHVPGRQGGIEGLRFDAAVSTGRRTRFRLKDARWKEGPWGSTLRRLAGEYTSGDSVRVSVEVLDTPDVRLVARAAWKNGESRRQVWAKVDRVRWAWLARVFDNGAFDVPGEGHVRVTASGDRQWKGRFDGSFEWSDLEGTALGNFDYDGVRWRISELEGRSPAGDLTGRLDYAKDGWALTADVVRGDPSRWGAIHVTGWPKGQLRGRFRYAVDARKDGVLEAWLANSELGGWRADSARVTVHFFPTADDTFEVRARRRGGNLALFGSARAHGWRGRYTLDRLPLDEWPDGRASGLKGQLLHGEGTVEGRSDGFFVRGELAGESTEWLGVKMARWRADGLEGRLLPTPDLAMRTRLEDALYLGVHFDSSALSLRVGDETVRLDDVRAWGGDTLVTVAGDARWGSGGWSANFERARMKSTQFDWIAEPSVLLSGDPQGVSFGRLLARDGEAEFTATGRWAAPGGRYDCTMNGRRLSLSRLGLPPEWHLSGRVDATLHVTGMSGDPRWTLDADASDPSYDVHQATSLRLALTGAPHRLEVREARFEEAGGSFSGSGRFENMRAAWPDTLSGEGVVHWLSEAGSWSGRFEGQNVVIDGLGALVPAAAEWTGRASGTLRLGGTPGRPELELDARAEPIAFRDYRVDRATARARYDGSHLTVDDFRLVRGSVESTARGTMAIRLGLGKRPEVPDEPMRWTFNLPDGDLGLLATFVPQFGYAAGRFDLDATLSGTPRKPALVGTGRVRQGVMRMSARDEILEDVYADMHFDQTRLTLDTLSARQHPSGKLTGRGVVDLRDLKLAGYRFDLAMRDFTTSDPSLYAAVFDGNFVVTNGRRLYGQTLPHVEGRAEVSEARVFIDFANQTEGEQLAASTVPLFWTYRIELNATDNIRWQPPDADIEFSADLTLEQTVDSLLIYGEMHALRGTYNFFSTQFRVQQADLTFDNLHGVDPVVDAVATTRITPPNEEPHTVTVAITGRSREPVVAFSSEPSDWDDSVILSQLTFRRVDPRNTLIGNLQDPADSYLTQAINRTLSAELSRTFKGYLNDWQIEREKGGLLGQGGLIVGFSTQPVRNVNLRYRQRVPGGGRDYSGVGTLTDPFERSVEAEYRLSRFFFVTSEYTQHRDASGSTRSGPADFNVNLKARWEY